MPKNVIHTLKGAEVHMEDEQLLGRPLAARIIQDCKDSQLFAGVLLPDFLYLTQEQHNSILDGTEPFGNKHMFNAGLCVMEIVIVDKDES